MIPDDPEVPDMIVALREALDSPDPLDLLSIASGILAALEPLPGPFGSPLDDDDPIVDVSEFMDMLVSMPSEETDSLLVACAELLDDPVLQAIVQTEVRPRIQVMPPWLAELARLRVTRAVLLESVLDGEETIALQATGPRGGFTLMVAIERLGSPFVEDAYAISETIDGLIDRLDQDQPEDLVVRPLQLKDARARIEDGLETTGMLVPPVETETWPGFRPLLEWALRGIPEGGEGYIYEEWEQEDIEAFLDEFMESRHAFGYLRRDRQLAGLLVDFALNYGTWDPRQWSPRFVERVLLDLIPRKVMYPLEDLQAFPRILGALVMFGNESLNIPDSTTQRVLNLIEELIPHYLELIDPDIMDDESDWFEDVLDGHPFLGPDPLTLLADAVGGEEALENLDADPLPIDEPLNLGGVAEDVRERVVAIGDLIAKHAPQYFPDPEILTAAYRTLHLIAAEKPEVLRRRSKDLNTAAVILYIAGHNNRWFTRTDPEKTVKALSQTMGVSAVDKDRAFNVTSGLHTAHTAIFDAATLSLGRPELLTSSRRKDILTQKRDYEKAIEELERWT